MSTHWAQRENLAQAIAEISDQLLLPLSSGEQLVLMAGQRALREQLASLEGPDTLASLGLSEWEVPGAGM